MDKENLIKKWLNNELTPAEKETFEQGEDFDFNQAICDAAKQFKASNFSKPKSFTELKSAYQINKQTTRQLDWFKPLLKIAAVIVVVLGIYFTLFKTNQTVVETLLSEQVTIELPDASMVTLNADSEIVYTKNNWETNRKLRLDGEAYFKVAKGKTFDVITSQGLVTVVGTEFNVKQRNDYFEVQCFEGIVKVTSGRFSETLTAGDVFRVIYNEFTQDITTALQPEWTQNRSSFKAIPLKAVFAELQRQYNISIRLRSVNEERLFTGGFVHDNLEKALLSITQPMNLSYQTTTSNEVIIYGNKE